MKSEKREKTVEVSRWKGERRETIREAGIMAYVVKRSRAESQLNLNFQIKE